MPDAPHPVLAELVRSGFTESWHRGSAALITPGGSIIASAGDPGDPIFPRSSNKPMQAAGMLACGLKLRGHLLALAAASHSGEDFHIEGVREILAGAGLSEDALLCPPSMPLGADAAAALLRAGGSADRIHMNCSGKHAAMLATCVSAGWPVSSYTDPGHPLQLAIRRTTEELAGEPVTAVGVDGCGAPLLALSPAGLARAFSAMVTAVGETAGRRVADAMRGHPGWMSGTGRTDALLMDAVPGLLVKIGAEGVCAFALADGRAGAIKIDDGGERPVEALAAACLLALDAREPVPGLNAAALRALTRPPVTGGGEPVGELKVTWPGEGEGVSN